MILAKEIDGELWVKATDCEQAISRAVADEREACAKLCEVNHHTIRRNMDSFECAAAIRARGQA